MLTPNQAVVDRVFDALSEALPDVDFTPYDYRGLAYVLDFEDGSALLLEAEAYEPLTTADDVTIGDFR